MIVETTNDTIIQNNIINKSLQIPDIKEGFIVEVVFNGSVTELNPAQGIADIIRVISNVQN